LLKNIFFARLFIAREGGIAMVSEIQRIVLSPPFIVEKATLYWCEGEAYFTPSELAKIWRFGSASK
jgi:hypothetical protein